MEGADGVRPAQFVKAGRFAWTRRLESSSLLQTLPGIIINLGILNEGYHGEYYI